MTSVYLLVPLMTLVPIIPAYILFKTLRSKAGVTGKEFYGFNVQLGGAFAGYFVLLLLLWQIFKPFLVPAPQLVYTFHGQILDDQKQGVPLTDDNLVFVPARPMITTSLDGNFTVRFFADPNQSSTFPTIEISYQDYIPRDFVLDRSNPNAEKQLKITGNTIYAEPVSLSRPDPGKNQIHYAEPIPIAASDAVSR